MRGWWWVLLIGTLARGMVLVCDPPTGGLGRLEPSVIADNLNAGLGFTFEQYGTTYRAWKEPLYIVGLAWLTRWMGSSGIPVMFVQWLFGLSTAVGVAWLARQLLGDPLKATLAGMIAAANPFLVYYDTHWIYPLSLDAWLFVAVTGTILLATDAETRARRTVWAGLVAGLALWQKAALMASGGVAWLVACLSASRHDRWLTARRAAIWLGIAVVVIAPWLSRNYGLFGRLLLTTDSAHILWLGNNPWSHGTYSDMTGRRVIELADPAFLSRLNGAAELHQYDLFLEEVLRFIREQPGRCASLVVARLEAFFWFSPNAGLNYTEQEGMIYRLAYVSLLTLGIIGFVLCWRRRVERAVRRRLLITAGAIVGLAAVHAVTAINLKHRVPWELVLAVGAAEPLGRFAERLARRFSRRRLL